MTNLRSDFPLLSIQVNKYIEDFGGDKHKVTLMGESAGSVSVNYMMLVPPARGQRPTQIYLVGKSRCYKELIRMRNSS